MQDRNERCKLIYGNENTVQCLKGNLFYERKVQSRLWKHKHEATMQEWKLNYEAMKKSKMWCHNDLQKLDARMSSKSSKMT